MTAAGNAPKIGFLFVVSRICLHVMSSICALAGRLTRPADRRAVTARAVRRVQAHVRETRFERLTFLIITSHDVIPLRLRHHFRPTDRLMLWCRCASI